MGFDLNHHILEKGLDDDDVDGNEDGVFKSHVLMCYCQVKGFNIF